MSIKIRPAILVIAVGLVIALVWAVAVGNMEMVSVISVALAGSLTKLVESEEVSGK
jgi:hypothetical protein